MKLEYQVGIAFGADLLLGDPRWLPHPVKLIGRFAAALETPLRRAVPSARTAGVIVVAMVLGATGSATWLLITAAGRVHPLAGEVVSIVLLYLCLAARDLARHSYRVYRALADGDLASARERVAMLVGRDTDRLDEPEIVRAAVESVAENIVDGVTAPLFFALIAGPIGAMLYKAVNTLDSTFGYKNERYLHFGWASARLDDLVNYVPARVTAPLVSLAAVLLGLDPLGALRIFVRDGRKHPSPNSGLTEAAVAGALRLQLGGLNYYFGQPTERPRMGDPGKPSRPAHILKANTLMMATSCLALLLFTAVRVAIVGGWR
jgi:adenosylcobinamide-phosphate synthase